MSRVIKFLNLIIFSSLNLELNFDFNDDRYVFFLLLIVIQDYFICPILTYDRQNF